MASTRLPGKPLLARTGKPLIQHVVEQAQQARCLRRVVVATDSPDIIDAVHRFGAQAILTGEHPNGTSRLAEALTLLDDPHDLIVNIQGDEPEVSPATIDALAQGLADDPDAAMATLYSPFAPHDDPANPNIVKVVKTAHDRVLYFSRSLIPFHRDPHAKASPPTLYKHPGLYAYRRAFLLNYADLTPTPLEQAEQLEQLRVLEHGHAIRLVRTDHAAAGIDTPDQYNAFVARHHASRHDRH